MNRFSIIIALLAASCAGGKPAPTTPQSVPAPQASPKQETRLLVSKGTIRSDRGVRIFSTLEGQLTDFNLIEGETVRTGQILFRLDDTEIKGRIALKESEVRQARLKMEEILVGQGYKRDSLASAPASIREYARIKSGLDVRETELEQARAMLRRTVIASSLSGVVTGINALPYGFVKPGETLCTIVDPDELIVVFSILETELRKFRIGTEIELRAIAYADVPHSAVVRSIGSVVDEGGMVKVEAVISDTTDLIPGMTAIINL